MVPVPIFGTHFFEQIRQDFILKGGSEISGQYLNLLKYILFMPSLRDHSVLYLHDREYKSCKRFYLRSLVFLIVPISYVMVQYHMTMKFLFKNV